MVPLLLVRKKPVCPTTWPLTVTVLPTLADDGVIDAGASPVAGEFGNEPRLAGCSSSASDLIELLCCWHSTLSSFVVGLGCNQLKRGNWLSAKRFRVNGL